MAYWTSESTFRYFPALVGSARRKAPLRKRFDEHVHASLPSARMRFRSLDLVVDALKCELSQSFRGCGIGCINAAVGCIAFTSPLSSRIIAPIPLSLAGLTFLGPAGGTRTQV